METSADNVDASAAQHIAAELGRIAGTLEAQHAAADPTREQRDLNAQEDMATWARAMFWAAAVQALLSAIGIALIYVTFRETRRAANSADEIVSVTRASAEQQLRAYISVDTLRINTLATGAPLVVWMTITNRGQTPARRLEFRDCVIRCIGTEPERAGVKLRKAEKIYDLGAGQGTAQPIIMTAEPLTQPQIDSIRDGGAAFVVAGYLRYRDVFGRQRRTIFRSTFNKSCILNPDNEGHYYLTVAKKGVRSS